jgi:DNA repair protein RadD
VELFGYQQTAIADVESKWGAGARSVLLVAPTGSGKTEMGARLVGDRTAVWIAHRHELVDQAAERLRASFGHANVGVIMPGTWPNPKARVQVASAQTLLARSLAFKAEVMVIDEAHHYLAAEWRALADAGKTKLTLGLTATPERADGKPLGDIFEQLVVAAQYSELIRAGHLVRAVVYRPAEYLGKDIAQDPVDAYLRYGRGERAFVFLSSVEAAYAAASRLRSRRVRAETVEANSGLRHRGDAIANFTVGRVEVLTNVFALTEGVNVPASGCAVLGRSFDFAGNVIQACGRTLRSAPGKTAAIIIDLSGCTNKHGMPDADREYSLTGRAISAPRDVEIARAEGDGEQEVLGIDLTPSAEWGMPEGFEAAAVASSSVTDPSEPDAAVAVGMEIFDMRAAKKKKGWKQSLAVREHARRMREKFLEGSK